MKIKKEQYAYLLNKVGAGYEHFSQETVVLMPMLLLLILLLLLLRLLIPLN